MLTLGPPGRKAGRRGGAGGPRVRGRPVGWVCPFERRHALWLGEDRLCHGVVAGQTGRLRGPLHHPPYRDLGEHLRTIDRYTALAAAGLRRRGPGWGGWLRPWAHLFKALVLKGGVLDGQRGLSLALLGAAAVSLKWQRAAAPTDDPAAP